MRALLGVAERESQRLAQRLHDDLCQVLLGATFSAKALAQRLPPESPVAADLDDLVRLINSAVEAARCVMRDLNPVGLDAAGLVTALRELVAQPPGMACRLECDGPVSVPDSVAARHLFRIAQDAVANAAQHSGGTELVVRLNEDERHVHLEISDNGRGFKRSQNGREGFGLALMKYRAEAINARLRCDIRGKGGTSITCSLPRRK